MLEIKGSEILPRTGTFVRAWLCIHTIFYEQRRKEFLCIDLSLDGESSEELHEYHALER
jgi:hypothetical protein